MKHLTILTHAPSGTLGDPTLCIKFAEELLKKDPELKIKLVVTSIDKPGHWRAVDGLTKTQHDNLEIQCLSSVVSYYKQEDSFHFDGRDALIKLSDNTDCIIVYPTFHLLEKNEIQTLNMISKKLPVLYVSNYNFQESEQNRYNTIIENTKLPTYDQLLNDKLIIETGIGKNKLGEPLLGIYISERVGKKFDLHSAIETLNQADLKSVKFIVNADKDKLLTNTDLDQYRSNTNLYFGYYNNLIGEADNNWANATSFVKLAILDSLNKNANIDIVIPLRDDETSKKSGNNFEKIIDKIDLKDVTVEYWRKDPISGEMINVQTKGQGPTKVRLINAFPFAKEAMSIMQKISDPLTLVTGNSSFAEAIENDNIILYQTMFWHTRLDKDMLALIESDPPFSENHPFRQFHSIIHDAEVNKEERLATLLSKNRAQILEGAKVFHDFVFNNYNLQNNLPETVLNRVQSLQNELKNKSINLTPDENNMFYDFHMISDELFSEFSKQIHEPYFDFKKNKILDESKVNKNELLLFSFLISDLQTARLLLEKGADPNTILKIEDKEYNPLYFCMIYRLSEKLLQELLQSKSFDLFAALEILRNNDESPYMRLHEFTQHHILSMLIESAKNKGENPRSLFKGGEKGMEVSDFFSMDSIYIDILMKEQFVPFMCGPAATKYIIEECSTLINKDMWKKLARDVDKFEGLIHVWMNIGLDKFKSEPEFLKEFLYSPASPLFKVLANDKQLIQAMRDKDPSKRPELNVVLSKLEEFKNEQATRKNLHSAAEYLSEQLAIENQKSIEQMNNSRPRVTFLSDSQKSKDSPYKEIIGIMKSICDEIIFNKEKLYDLNKKIDELPESEMKKYIIEKFNLGAEQNKKASDNRPQ